MTSTTKTVVPAAAPLAVEVPAKPRARHRSRPWKDHAPDEHVLPTYKRAAEVFVAGDGALVHDAGGRVWIDFLSGIAVNALGHAHPRLVRALRDQAGKLLHTSNLYRHPYTEEVAARLARLTGLGAVFFSNSGAEANEAAMKLARKRAWLARETERTGFVALEGAFHGRTMGALALTHAEKYRAPFGPLVPGVEFVAPGDTARLEALLATRRFAALFVEPIQGEAGVRELAPEFLRAARAACDATGTLLVHDEVQCGAGRTGTFLAADAAGVKPDLVTLAKPIAGGLPLGALVVRPELAGVFEPGDHGSTFAGGPLALRAALVFLDELERGGLFENVRARGAELAQGLVDLAHDFPLVTGLPGRGLMRGLVLARGAEELQKDLHERGLLVNRTSGNVIRLLPPFVVTSEQLARGLALLRAGLTALG
jgi:predicted acetylornithine/succinylornithine family transaminase